MGRELTEADVLSLATAVAGSGGGGGGGDMEKSVYDSDNDVASAGGIKMYVAGQISSAITDALSASY